MKLHRPRAFAGFLIIGMIAVVGFAAFSVTGLRSAPPLDLPDAVSARIAGQILGIDLGPDAPTPDSTSPGAAEAPTSGDDADAAPALRGVTAAPTPYSLAVT